MAVPTTNVSLGSIQTEFGGSAPTSINEYYRGGTYVPIGTTSSYGTIPTSGQIDFGVFRGTSKAVTPLVDWADIIDYSSVSPIIRSNAAVTMPSSITLSITRIINDILDGTVTFKVFKNNVDLGDVLSFSVNAGDTVYFQARFTGVIGGYVNADYEIYNGATLLDTFFVYLERTA